MNFNNKILPVALVAALTGGSVGAFVMRPTKSENPQAVATTKQPDPVIAPAHNSLAAIEAATFTQPTPIVNTEQSATVNENVTPEMAAYRQGFAEGAKAMREEVIANQSDAESRAASAPKRVVYRNSRSANYARYSSYEPRKRSFWSKHRDKLTVGIGTGAGAAVGGLIGGKKGAAIGALAGAGGSALYTYKLRKKNRNY